MQDIEQKNVRKKNKKNSKLSRKNIYITLENAKQTRKFKIHNTTKLQRTWKCKTHNRKECIHITKEDKKREHKKIQDLGDTKNLQHT